MPVSHPNTQLRIAFLNVNGLSNNKVDQILPLTNTYDIVFLAETWSLSLDRITQHPTFIVHAAGKPRSDSRRADGGLCCLSNISIKASITVTRRTFNTISILVDGKVRVSCVYLPPSMNPVDFNNSMTTLVDSDIVLGDFNARFGRFCHDTNTGPRNRIDFLQQWQLVRSLSHIPPLNQTRTDHVYCRFPAIVFTNDPPCATDHTLLSSTIEIPGNLKRNSALQTLIAGTKRFHLGKLNELDTKNRLTGAYMSRTNQMDQLLEQAEESIQNYNNPLFFNPEFDFKTSEKQKIIDLIDENLKNSISECARKILGQYNVDVLKSTKPPIERLQQSPSNTSAVRLFKMACRPQRKIIQSNNPNQTVENNVMDHFKTVYGRSPASTFNHEHHRFPAAQGFSAETLETFGAGSNNFREFITTELVQKFITSYDNTKACGDDSLHNRILLALVHTKLPEHLSRLFKLCAACGITPTRWNISIVHPLPKTSDANTIDKCRPIAISVMFRRIFEGCLLRYWNHANFSANVLSTSRLQGGFRSGYSTLTHAAASNDTLYTSRYNMKYRCFIDLKQAYDRVPIELLLEKLRARNMEAGQLSLLLSMFGGCSTIPLVNGRKLKPVSMLRGLFQGSLLSPMLFNMFIDDLSRELDTEELRLGTLINHLLLADDLQLMASSFDHLRTMTLLFDRWAEKNGMEPCAHKSGYIGPILSANQAASLTLAGTQVPIVKEYKYVGFTQDKHGINWTLHFKRLGEKTNKLLCFCQANGSGWPEWVKLMIYKAFIRPSFEYGAQLMAVIPSDITSLIYKSLEAINHRCLKWILPYGSNMTIITTVLGLPAIQTRFTNLSCLFVRHLNNMSPNNPCIEITTELERTVPWMANIILPRTKRNSLYKDLSRQVTQHLSLRTILLKRQLQILTQGSRTGHTIQKEARINSYGADYTISIRDKNERQTAISWRTNSWGTRRLCSEGHTFRKSCLTQCHSLQSPLFKTTRTEITNTPNISAIDDSLNNRDTDRFMELITLLEHKLL